jgi:hypothetical protein
LVRQELDALKRADMDRFGALAERRKALEQELRRKWHARLAQEPPGTLDPVVLERYRELCERTDGYETGWEVARELAPRFGQAPGQGQTPDPATIRQGYLYRQDLLIELGGLEFDDPVLGLAELKKWLEDHGFTGLRYEIYDNTDEHLVAEDQEEDEG